MDIRIKEYVDDFEARVMEDLRGFLVGKGVVDSHFPECPDVEEKWSETARDYLPDGAREFQQYPVVSLGWIMFTGMAMAYYWDTDWEAHAGQNDIYRRLRDMRGYDNMDDAIVEDVLGYKDEDAAKVSDIVAQSASRVYSMLLHEHVEAGTELALGCYIAALHCLYLAGMAMELKALGYHMAPLN